MDNSSRPPAYLDRIAIALSGLCLLHCLLLPFAVVLLPFLGQFTDDHLHLELLLVVIPLSIVAIGFGFQRHGNKGVIALGLAGLGLLIVGGTIAHEAYGLLADRTLTIAGSLLLAATHYRNFNLSRSALRSSL